MYLKAPVERKQIWKKKGFKKEKFEGICGYGIQNVIWSLVLSNAKKGFQLVFQLTTVCDHVNVWHLIILPNTAVISVSCAGGKWRDVTEDDSMYVTRRECSRLKLRLDVFYFFKKLIK